MPAARWWVPEVTTIVEERVQVGAAYLDAEFPGWEAYIDREALHMDDSRRCVLGQLATKMPAFAEMPQSGSSPYLDVIRWLVPATAATDRDTWGHVRGFVDDEDGGVTVGVTYAGLQAAWLKLLEERQAVYAVRSGSTPEPAPMTQAEDEAFRDEYESRGIFGDE